MDSGFIRRVVRTSLFLWIFLLLWCIPLKSMGGAIGITIGLMVSLASFMHIKHLTEAVITPETIASGGHPIRKLVGLALVRFAAIAIVLWASLRFGSASPAGLMMGIGLPYLVIFLKALGSAVSFGPEVSRRL